MNKRFFSLQYKVLTFSLVLGLIPILIMGFFSFSESSKIVQQKVSISNLNTVRQVGERIEFIFQDVHDMTLFLIQNSSVREFFKLNNNEEDTDFTTKTIKLQNELMYLISSKPYVSSIYFKGFNGVSLDTKNAINPIDEETEKEIIRLKGGYTWKVGKLTNYDGSSTNVFYIVRVVNNIYNVTNKLAIMKININEEELSNIYSNKIMGKQDDYIIIDANKKIVSSINNERLGQVFSLDSFNTGATSQKEGYYQTKVNGQDYLVTYYVINPLNYTLINLVPLKELLKENRSIEAVMTEVAVISFIVCILFAFLFSLKVLGPLKNIRQQMIELEKENFDVQVTLTGNDEITMLGRSFNRMSGKLKELINQVYLGRIHQKEAELAALQAQINPHFLYNALDTIYWMGRMEKAFETSKLVEALAKLFRLSLNSGRQITLLRDEVDHLQNYMIIQQKRYGDSINFIIDIEEGLLECNVVVLVLQPLVENAITHGIDKKDGKGNISVYIKKIDENLIYEITDDGIGIDVNEMNSLLKSVADSNRGLGVKNVNDRLKLYYGEAYGIEFIGEKGKGTTVIVRQPYMKGGNSIGQTVGG